MHKKKIKGFSNQKIQEVFLVDWLAVRNLFEFRLITITKAQHFEDFQGIGRAYSILTNWSKQLGLTDKTNFHLM
jgi:hypothetical protein